MTSAGPLDDGLRFFLLSQLSSTTDEDLRRIQAAGAVLTAGAAHAHRLARPSIACVSSAAEIPGDRNAVGVVFARTISDPSALAYHTLTAAGLATCLVLADPAKTSRGDRENGALHEILETLGDRDCVDYRLRAMPDGSMCLDSFELCDRVQGDSKPYDLGKGDPVNTPNYLLPNAFTDTPVEGELYDAQGKHTAPWELSDNSYAVRIYTDSGSVKTEGTGALAKLVDLASHARAAKRIVSAHRHLAAMLRAA